MDSISHIAIGACMGEIFGGKKLGNKAMIWGAIAQSLPDIDFIASFWMDTASNLLAHRGFTHSFLFVLIASPILAFITDRFHRPLEIQFKTWLIFFIAVIGSHVLIDAFNNYGTAWWEPFHHHRVTFNTIYVADPFLSIWPVLAFVILLIRRGGEMWRKKIAVFGLTLSLVYLVYGIANKVFIDQEVRRLLKTQQVVYDDYFTTPAPLQTWLWYVVAGDSTGFHVGFISLFDKKDTLKLTFFPRNEHLFEPLSESEELSKLKRFSEGFYTAEMWHDTLVFNDLRFGQMIGWEQPDQKFVFHYYLKEGADNSVVVQRGRFAFWNGEVFQTFFKRIFGY